MDIAKGNFLRDDQPLSRGRLSAQDCLFIAKHCFNLGELALSLEWFDTTLKLAEEESVQKSRPSLNVEKAKELYQIAREAHDEKLDMPWKDMKKLFPRKTTDKKFVSPNVQRELIEELRAQNVRDYVKGQNATDGKLLPSFFAYAEEIFESLCRGEELRVNAKCATSPNILAIVRFCVSVLSLLIDAQVLHVEQG